MERNEQEDNAPTPTTSSSESSKLSCLAGGEFLSDAAASFELSLSTPSACAEVLQSSRELDVVIIAMGRRKGDGCGNRERGVHIPYAGEVYYVCT